MWKLHHLVQFKVFLKNVKNAFRPRKYTLYVDFHRRNPKFAQSRKTFLRVSSMKMAFQMRFVEAKRKLSMCSFLKSLDLPNNCQCFDKFGQNVNPPKKMGKMPCFLTKSWDIYTHFSFSPKLKWPRFWSQMIPNFYIISYVYVSYEKREYKNNMEIFNQTRHFFICQSSFISFKSLTSLKTALKNYTWKVCVLPQQNSFGRPFSLKKHEEMFCDFA